MKMLHFLSLNSLQVDASTPPRRRPLPPVKDFSNGKLMYHTSYKRPEPNAFVDTGLYGGGRHNYYEAITEDNLPWLHSINKYHPECRACPSQTRKASTSGCKTFCKTRLQI